MSKKEDKSKEKKPDKKDEKKPDKKDEKKPESKEEKKLTPQVLEDIKLAPPVIVEPPPPPKIDFKKTLFQINYNIDRLDLNLNEFINNVSSPKKPENPEKLL